MHDHLLNSVMQNSVIRRINSTHLFASSLYDVHLHLKIIFNGLHFCRHLYIKGDKQCKKECKIKHCYFADPQFASMLALNYLFLRILSSLFFPQYMLLPKIEKCIV